MTQYSYLYAPTFYDKKIESVSDVLKNADAEKQKIVSENYEWLTGEKKQGLVLGPSELKRVSDIDTDALNQTISTYNNSGMILTVLIVGFIGYLYYKGKK